MFRDAKAFSSFAVDDIPRAKEFYAHTLGLEVFTDPAGNVLSVTELADTPT